MASDGEPVKLQQHSSGIEFDNYQGKWITCVYEEDSIINKEEKYIFRCSADKQCCGNKCCIPIAAGIPLWLLILILVLVFLLVLLLLAGIIYYCWKYCRRKQVVKKPVPIQPPPRKEPLPPPLQQPPPIQFVPSHMEETFENAPTPIPISYHDENEISTEKRPLINRLERPEEQKAQMMYYRSGAAQVASYNDMRS